MNCLALFPVCGAEPASTWRSCVWLSSSAQFQITQHAPQCQICCFSNRFFVVVVVLVSRLEPESVHFPLRQSRVWKPLPRITKNSTGKKNRHRKCWWQNDKCCRRPFMEECWQKKKELQASALWPHEWKKIKQQDSVHKESGSCLFHKQRRCKIYCFQWFVFFVLFFCQQPQHKTRFLWVFSISSLTSPAREVCKDAVFLFSVQIKCVKIIH